MIADLAFRIQKIPLGKIMSKLEWKSSYSVGVRELDLQHEKLLQIINLLGVEDTDQGVKKAYLF